MKYSEKEMKLLVVTGIFMLLLIGIVIADDPADPGDGEGDIDMFGEDSGTWKQIKDNSQGVEFEDTQEDGSRRAIFTGTDEYYKRRYQKNL